MAVAEGDEGVHLGPGDVDVPGEVELEQPLEDVLGVVRGEDGGQVPVQLGQQQELPLLRTRETNQVNYVTSLYGIQIISTKINKILPSGSRYSTMTFYRILISKKILIDPLMMKINHLSPALHVKILYQKAITNAIEPFRS